MEIMIRLIGHSMEHRMSFYDDQIHFPNIATTGHRRGFGTGEIIAIGTSSITLSESLIRFNDSRDLEQQAWSKLCMKILMHWDKRLMTQLKVVVITWIFQVEHILLINLTIPTGFTIRGNGKNTIIKRQFFANDGDGQLVGIDGTSCH